MTRRPIEGGMGPRADWLDLARKLDWELSYVKEEDAFPPEIAGRPWLPGEKWRGWEEPFRLSFDEYVAQQEKKEAEVAALRGALGRGRDLLRQPVDWVNALKLHTATLSLAEFAAVIGNLRAVRFGRDSAWRHTATLGALDELRHTQLQLRLGHEWIRVDSQFDWTHKLLHSDNWVAIAARHLIDELILAADPIEFAIGTHFVFETGFTNLEFIGVASVANEVGDRWFERLITSIQSDEARHAQVGEAVLRIAVREDRARVQYLLDKWFWRSARFFSIVTGFCMDYLTPLDRRARSFREAAEEWISSQYIRSLDALGLERPWYWDQFIESLAYYHHMVYASAYTYRATTWFDFVLPGPAERGWLGSHYPDSWPSIDPVWDRVAERWRETDVGNDLAVHGTAIIGFCKLCQLVLCGGTPDHNRACVIEHEGEKLIFCSEPCRWIFEQEPARYRGHRTVVERVLAGEAPGNLVALLKYFGLSHETWGKDAYGGDYPWLKRTQRR